MYKYIDIFTQLKYLQINWLSVGIHKVYGLIFLTIMHGTV